MCSSKIEPSSNEVVKPLQYGWLQILLLPVVNGRCHTHAVHILRAAAIRFGVVRFVVCVQERYILGGSGGMFPQKILAMRLLLRPFWGQYDASRRPDDRVWHEWMSTLSAHCVVYYWWTSVMKNLVPPNLSLWTKYLVPPDWIFQHWIWNIQSPPETFGPMY